MRHSKNYEPLVSFGWPNRILSGLAGAIREVHEETSPTLAAIDCRYVHTEWVKWRGLKAYCHFFIVELASNKPLQKQRGEIIDAEWVPVGQIGRLHTKPEIRQALQLLANP